MSLSSKLAIFGFFLFLLPISFAQANDFIAVDSIGVQKVGDKTFILHRVSELETLFSISRRYKVAMGDIQGANEALKQGLKVGETILVPYSQSIVPITSPVVNSTEVKTSVDVPSQTVVPSSVPTQNGPAPTSETRTNATIHKVKSGETLFAISNKYGVTVEELKAWNDLKGDKVKVDQALKIQKTIPVNESKSSLNNPSSASESVTAKKEETKKEEKVATKKEQVPAEKKEASGSNPAATSYGLPGEWISHTIKSGETLFSLSNQYGSTVEELIKWNGLSSNNLKIGQSIKVGRAQVSTVVVPTVGESKTNTSSAGQSATASRPSSTSEEVTTTTFPNTSGGFSNKKEMGLAELIPNTSGNKKYLVLHRTAPVGSVIRIKNEENDLTIFARVIGVLPETGDNGKLLIKLSQAAFDQLKAVNQRFPVEILY
jgi:LysM repeat protein